MKLKKIKTLFIGAMVCLFGLAGCGGHSTSSSGNEDPYAKVTLTEAGAARVNAAINRQNNIRQRYSKYSSWLRANFLAPQTRATVVEGDPVEEDMNFEIYPADLNALDSMFLIGRTKANVQQLRNLRGGLLAAEADTNENVENLIEITTNIPVTEISEYNLNGEVFEINGEVSDSKKIQFDTIPYQTTTEFTMTYTYIKKGTAATSSPYSCQPTFSITKVDNEAPKQTESSELSCSMSYATSVEELKTRVTNDIKSKFSVNDTSLEMVVEFVTTDSELGTQMSSSIAAAQADTENHQFTPVNLAFKVRTVNNETEELEYTVNLVDDIAPQLRRDGRYYDELHLNAGTELKLPHLDTINSGANALVGKCGYSIEDEIEGITTLDFDVSYTGYLKTTISVNRVNKEILDSTTKFNWESSPYYNRTGVTVDKNGYIWYCFDYTASTHNCFVELTDLEQDVAVINDFEIINANTDFAEKLIAESFNGGVCVTKALVINLSKPANLNVVVKATAKVYFKGTSASTTKIYNVYGGFNGNYIPTSNIYTDAGSYNSSWYYEYEPLCNTYAIFLSPVTGELSEINYNYAIDVFKANFCS